MGQSCGSEAMDGGGVGCWELGVGESNRTRRFCLWLGHVAHVAVMCIEMCTRLDFCDLS